mmetsp:Transcript_22243/g.77959  ORF Transcript_22243/g.77959 Transcript_22243/m.77959 type:complete len:452 (+) Transcript_22243:172-1527(+)
MVRSERVRCLVHLQGPVVVPAQLRRPPGVRKENGIVGPQLHRPVVQRGGLVEALELREQDAEVAVHVGAAGRRGHGAAEEVGGLLQPAHGLRGERRHVERAARRRAHHRPNVDLLVRHLDGLHELLECRLEVLVRHRYHAAREEQQRHPAAHARALLECQLGVSPPPALLLALLRRQAVVLLDREVAQVREGLAGRVRERGGALQVIHEGEALAAEREREVEVRLAVVGMQLDRLADVHLALAQLLGRPVEQRLPLVVQRLEGARRGCEAGVEEVVLVQPSLVGVPRPRRVHAHDHEERGRLQLRHQRVPVAASRHRLRGGHAQRDARRVQQPLRNLRAHEHDDVGGGQECSCKRRHRPQANVPPPPPRERHARGRKHPQAQRADVAQVNNLGDGREAREPVVEAEVAGHDGEPRVQHVCVRDGQRAREAGRHQRELVLQQRPLVQRSTFV